MKKFFVLLTGALILASLNSASAMTERINLDLSASETAALTSAKEVVENVKAGNGLYDRLLYSSCRFNAYDGKVDFERIKIIPVFVDNKSGIEKMYQAEVQFNVNCPIVATP